MSDAVRVTGRDLTLEDVGAVAGGASVETDLPEGTRSRMESSRRAVDSILESGRAVYGVNTGFGRLSDVRVRDRDALGELQVNLLRSHACGVGEPMGPEEVRAMLLLRANALARGYSGVRPVVVTRLLELLERDVLPVVPREGSVGASGDLAPAAHLALVLIGEGRALHSGRGPMPGGEALDRAGIEPLTPAPKEGLALLNGTQAMTAVGTLALLRAESLADAADVAGAVSLEGLRGSPDPFDPLVQETRPHPGQEQSARRLRALLRDSEIRESHRYGDPRIQDAYSLRCMPQIHGAARDALAHVRTVLEREVNAATDNPLVDAGREAGERVLSQGNFHGQPVASALDYLAMGVCHLATASERRTDRLLNPDLSGLPAFLTPEPGLRSGLMMTQVTAASQVAACRHAAGPVSTGTIPTGAAKEDHVSMGAHAADQAERAVRAAERVIAIELIAGVQAVEFHRPLRAGTGVEAASSRLRRAVDRVEEDRPLGRDVRRAVELLRSGAMSRVIADCMGGGRGEGKARDRESGDGGGERF